MFVSDHKGMRTPDFKNKFRKRIYEWVLQIIEFIEHLPPAATCAVIGKQLLRSCTRVIANYVEAQSGSSRKDFVNFLIHALKSSNESLAWLSLLKDTARGIFSKRRN